MQITFLLILPKKVICMKPDVDIIVINLVFLNQMSSCLIFMKFCNISIVFYTIILKFSLKTYAWVRNISNQIITGNLHLPGNQKLKPHSDIKFTFLLCYNKFVSSKCISSKQTCNSFSFISGPFSVAFKQASSWTSSLNLQLRCFLNDFLRNHVT